MNTEERRAPKGASPVTARPADAVDPLRHGERKVNCAGDVDGARGRDRPERRSPSMTKKKAATLIAPIIRSWMPLATRHFAGDAAKDAIAILERAGIKFDI